MTEKEILGKIYDAIYETQYLTMLAMGYLESCEENLETYPLVLVFDEINKRTEVIKENIVNRDELQNHFET